jgi:hypothetical protein
MRLGCGAYICGDIMLSFSFFGAKAPFHGGIKSRAAATTQPGSINLCQGFL